MPDCKVSCKIKILKFGTKNAYFPYFWTGIWKYYCHVSNQRPRICLVAKFCAKIKILKFGTKNAVFWYFWAGIWKNPEICLTANFVNKTKMSKFETKNVWFRYFWASILENYCHIWNQHPQICLFPKFHE